MTDANDADRPDGPLPSGLELSSLSPAFREEPHRILDRLRREDPVHRDRDLDRVFLTRFEDVRAVTQDAELLVDPRKARETSFARKVIRDPNNFEPWLPHLDDPDHKRLRALVSKSFNVRSVEAYRPRLRAIAGTLLDSLAAKDQFDVISEYAAPLPIIAIAELLGVDPSDLEDFRRWSQGLSQLFNPKLSPEQGLALYRGHTGLQLYFKESAESRRYSRGDDLISALVGAEEDGARLSAAEVVWICSMLLVGGNQTTTDLIGNGALALLRHPDQLAKLRASPDLAVNTIEEILRYDPPVAQLTCRIVPTAHEIGCARLEAGDTISASLLAAAHDSAANPDPHRFDIERVEPRHLSFGSGMHSCLGAALARAEGQIAIPLLFERFPRLRLDPEARVTRKDAPGFNGLEALWVRPE